MTEKEAIKRLKLHLEWGLSKDTKAATSMGIKALTKQATGKVKFEDAGYNHYQNVNVYSCRCPSCRLDIIMFDDNDVSDDCDCEGDVEKMFHSSMIQGPEGMNSYCNRCGQKLDWGD